jgi:hypothetical protein
MLQRKSSAGLRVLKQPILLRAPIPGAIGLSTHLRNLHPLPKLQGRARPHSKDFLPATPRRPPSRKGPSCPILRTEKGPDAPCRFSIEAEAGVTSAIVMELEEKSSDSGGGDSGIRGQVRWESSYSSDGKSRISIDVREKSLGSGDAKSRFSIDAKEKSSHSGDGKLRIGIGIKGKSSEVHTGKLGHCIEVKDESSDSGRKPGISIKVKEKSSASGDGKSGISVKVKEKSSNSSSEKSDVAGFLTRAAIFGLFCMILWRTREKPDDGNVVLSLFLKAKLKTEKKLDKLEFQEFWRECQKGIEWREWKRHVSFETWLDARWEAYDRRVDVDEILSQWLDTEVNTVPPLCPSTKMSTIELRRWAMQRDDDTMRDVVAKTERHEAAMKRQREQQKKDAADHGQNCCKSASCQACKPEKRGDATFPIQPRSHICQVPMTEKRDRALDSRYPPSCCANGECQKLVKDKREMDAAGASSERDTGGWFWR